MTDCSARTGFTARQSCCGRFSGKCCVTARRHPAGLRSQASSASACRSDVMLRRDAPTADTGDYCRARAKLSEPALRELSTEIANEAEQQADEAWLWKRRHAKLIDGFTFTMPDTERNQAEFPHPRTQKKGVGLPIARSVAIMSLAIATVMDCATRSSRKENVQSRSRWSQP